MSQRRIEAWITAGLTRRAEAAEVFEGMLFDAEDLYCSFQSARTLVHALDNGTYHRDAFSLSSPDDLEHFAMTSQSTGLRQRLMPISVDDPPAPRLLHFPSCSARSCLRCAVGPDPNPAAFRDWVHKIGEAGLRSAFNSIIEHD